MPSLQSSSPIGTMSALPWSAAARRVAGAISLAGQPDALAAARDAITETLQDWDTRRDWRYSQVIQPDITLDGTGAFSLLTNFKKPYVAYIDGVRPLTYIERANWHRATAGIDAGSTTAYYTLYNTDSTGTGDVFPAGTGTLIVLYYRGITYADSDDAFLDIPSRWEGYILAGARARLIASKVASDKAMFWLKQYEDGVDKAKADDLRLPDQFLSFEAPSARPAWINRNAMWGEP